MVGKDLLDVETTLRTDGGAVVEVRGELDVATVERLRSHLSTLMNEGGRTFILDLSQLTFVDSTGLAALVEVDRVLRRLGGSLGLTNIVGQPFKVMELTGVLQALAPHPLGSSLPAT